MDYEEEIAQKYKCELATIAQRIRTDLAERAQRSSDQLAQVRMTHESELRQQVQRTGEALHQLGSAQEVIVTLREEKRRSEDERTREATRIATVESALQRAGEALGEARETCRKSDEDLAAERVRSANAERALAEAKTEQLRISAERDQYQGDAESLHARIQGLNDSLADQAATIDMQRDELERQRQQIAERAEAIARQHEELERQRQQADAIASEINQIEADRAQKGERLAAFEACFETELSFVEILRASDGLSAFHRIAEQKIGTPLAADPACLVTLRTEGLTNILDYLFEERGARVNGALPTPLSHDETAGLQALAGLLECSLFEPSPNDPFAGTRMERVDWKPSAMVDRVTECRMPGLLSPEGSGVRVRAKVVVGK